MVDLGPVSQFRSLAPGATLSFADRYSVTDQLLPTFGSVNGLTFSILGTQRGAGDVAANTSWLTLKRADVDVPTLAPFGYTVSKTANLQSAISGIYGDGVGSGVAAYAGSATYPPSTKTAIIVPTSGLFAADSYSVKYSAVGGLKSLVASPGVENTTPDTFSTTPGAVVRSDLYEYAPGTAAAPAKYLGNFTFGNDGKLKFTATPEPGEYALVALGLIGLLGGHAWNRRRAK